MPTYTASDIASLNRAFSDMLNSHGLNGGYFSDCFSSLASETVLATLTQIGNVSTSAQSFAGQKSFANGILTNAIGAYSASSLSLMGAPTDGATAIGTLVGSSTTLADPASKLLSVKNNAAEKFYIDKDGQLIVTGTSGITVGACTWTDTGVQSTFSHRTTNSEYWQAPLFYGTGSGVTLEAANTVKLSADGADGAAAVAVVSDSSSAWVDAGAKLHSFRNHAVEKASISVDGALSLNSNGGTQPAASASNRGMIWYTKSAGGVADKLEVCLKSAADGYSWVLLGTG